MDTEISNTQWTMFQSVNRARRAIRGFSRQAVPEEDILAVLEEATHAPSSGNLQPYQFHLVRSPDMLPYISKACHDQKAARTANGLIVVAASPAIGRRTVASMRAYIDEATTLEQKSKDYHLRSLKKFDKILRVGSWALWTPLMSLMTLLRPGLSLLPVGPVRSRNWVARNSIFAAQTIMLAAAAKEIDTCPMEGFSAPEIIRLLKLPRGTVIPVVIAFGYRAPDARIETQWRRPLTDVVVTH